MDHMPYLLDKYPSKGGFRRIKDFSEEKTCKHPEHNPPNMIVLKPGQYEYTCPSCGNVQTVIIPPKPSL